MQLVAVEALKPKWSKSVVSLHISIHYFDNDTRWPQIFMNMEAFHLVIYFCAR